MAEDNTQKEDDLTTYTDSDDDLWLDPDLARPTKKPRYHTWDSFLKAGGNKPVNPYLTEAGPRTFDAALELHQNDFYTPREAGTVVKMDVFVTVCFPRGLLGTCLVQTD